VAPAATNAPSAPAVPVAPTTADDAATAAPAFGTSRGSGLARGKRALHPATTSNSTTAANGDYAPTTIQIVTAGREYKNPFAPEQPAEVPASAAVAARPPEPASAPAPHAATAPAVASPQPADNAAAGSVPATADAGVGEPEKAEIKILPPVDKPRPAQHWDTSTPIDSTDDTSVHPSLRGDRPVFRPESQSGETRDHRAFRDRGERRRGGRDRERERDGYGDPRPPREPREPRPEASADAAPDASATGPAPKKSGGFFGWLKNLFGGSDDTAKAGTPARSDDGRREGRRDGRRGGRGGRNHDGGGGGFRGERRDDRPRGHHRDNPRDGYNHRQRGGRGRNSRYRGGERGGHRSSEGGGSSGDPSAS
jgi:translation initiation factor IF-2